MTLSQAQADVARMKKFICDHVADEIRIVLADGPEGGPAWADLVPVWDDEGDSDLLIETNEPEWIGLREVYEHYRQREMTSWERERERAAEVNRWKIHELQKEIGAMGYELTRLRQVATTSAEGTGSAISQVAFSPDLASIARSLARIADVVDPPPPDKVDTTYIAKRLGIGLARVSQMAAGGEIPPSCIVAGTGNGKLWKFHRARIDEWIDNGRT